MTRPGLPGDDLHGVLKAAECFSTPLQGQKKAQQTTNQGGNTVAGFGTSQEAMAAGAAHVDEASERVQGQINTLRTEVETMKGGWGGQAANAFVTLHQNFEGQANRINTALRAMQEALVSTRTTYATQEEQETSNISNMAGQINES
jgi:WXG100 family type VII secretion target